MENNWYILFTKPKKEVIVLHQLSLQKIEIFFPEIELPTTKPNQYIKKPYFPNYIFIKVNNEKINDPKIKWIPGLKEIVNFGGQPAIISDSLINLLRKRIDKHNERIKKNRSFEKGDPVQIISGPLVGYIGIFNVKLSGAKRAKILLEIVHGNISQLEISEKQIRLQE